MLDQDESVGFEWLDIPFVLTRILITLVGALCILATAMLVWECLPSLHSPPPTHRAYPEGEDEVFIVRRTPGARELLLEQGGLITLFFMALPIAAMVLVWRRPRLGFLLTGLAWAPMGIFGSLSRLFAQGSLEWFWRVVGLLPLAWIGYAWWKVGPDLERDS